MAKICSGFPLMHFFVLSVALNLAFISQVVYEGESSRKRVMEKEAHVSKASSQSSSSLTTTTGNDGTEALDDGLSVLYFGQGDPTMYERFWQEMGNKGTIVVSGWQSMSYFSDRENICWFLEPQFAKQIVRLHKLVGNALTENRHIVVGTGSSQLYHAALYALSSPDAAMPIDVVSAAPFYSSYPPMTDVVKSGLFKWAGDARSYSKNGPYIELVTSPNNPDGSLRQAVVNQSHGILVHDLAYYWPQYTPISSPADHDLMLFTFSKSMGHAGLRIGWALVKDEEVAIKMTKFIELNTIGVCKDSQLRAAKILQAVSDSYEEVSKPNAGGLFEFGHSVMAERWRQLRVAVKQSELFSLPDFQPGMCSFFGRIFATQPAFAWLECRREIEDCEAFLRHHRILTRGGMSFGASPKFARVSMVDRDKNFESFIRRLSAMSSWLSAEEDSGG